jgi:hypothetical protein
VEVIGAADTARVLAATDATVLVPFPELLSPRTLGRLAALPDGVRVVLVEPDAFTLGDLDAGVEPRNGDTRPVLGPGCDLAAARVAGTADVDLYRYDAPRAATSCYRGGLVVSRNLTYLGDRTPLTNAHLDEAGNAALALGLLTEHPRLVWLTMATPELGSEAASSGLGEVLPGWVAPVTVQLLLVGVAAALWRGRRLGAPVAEPLPVVVRSAETVEGRARLYRRARARDRAVAALRGGALSRLLPVLGLGPDPGRRALVESVADRSGLPAADVDGLLYGPVPADDARLVAVAADLDRLVAATLHTEGTPQ